MNSLQLIALKFLVEKRKMSKFIYRPHLEKTLELIELCTDTFKNKEPLFVPLGARGIFGGALIAQSLYAAHKTIPHHFHPHSLQSYFLSAGKPGVDVEYRVNRLRDGNNFISREVKAYQNNKIIFVELISFTQDRNDLINQPIHYKKPRNSRYLNVNNYKDPVKLLNERYLSRGRKPFESPTWYLKSLFDRFVYGPAEYKILSNYYDDTTDSSHEDYNLNPEDIDVDYFVKLRVKTESKIFHYIALAYFSDSYLLGSVWKFQKLKINSPRLSVSLDHTIHFHKQPNVNQWIYSQMELPRSNDARRLIDAGFYDPESGELIATIQQEGLVIVDENAVKL
ncbi:hypothetical protein WICMUC_004343 [Wickerhamomyces mucosus]|uniref:Acyl-CoA thioesterase II n=1 Tax=Wickerhamomyces mucosus TaxID=1378264 RepID=A0A9P8PHB4_9ASCO|nr:hypothetical protein WICMUC_004343 [Wickerhamomyces mucosus]